MDMELKIPPVVQWLVAAGVMWLIAACTAIDDFSFLGQIFFAVTCCVVGIVVGIVAILDFRKHHTTVIPHAPQQASTLVDSGVFRYSRNPMYLGLVITLVAWAIYLGSYLSFVVIVVFIRYLTRFQIVPEERVLLALFDESYAEYCKEVRRWF